MGGIVNTISKAVSGVAKAIVAPINSAGNILGGKGNLGDLFSVASLLAPGGNLANLSWKSIGDSSFRSVSDNYLKQYGLTSDFAKSNIGDYKNLVTGQRNLFGDQTALQSFAPGFGGYQYQPGPTSGATLTPGQSELVQQDLNKMLALRARMAAANDPRNFGSIASQFRNKALANADLMARREGSRFAQLTNNPNIAAALRLKYMNTATKQANDFQQQLYSPQSVTEALQRSAQIFDPTRTAAMFEQINRATGTLTPEQKRMLDEWRNQQNISQIQQLWGMIEQFRTPQQG